MLGIIIAILQIIFGFGMIGFWIYFLIFENKDPEKTEVYLVFERSFIIADVFWITPCLFISALGLITGKGYWVFYSIAAGSAILFLFLLDFSFNIQQGTYKRITSDNILEICVNILCMISAPLFMIYGLINL